MSAQCSCVKCAFKRVLFIAVCFKDLVCTCSLISNPSNTDVVMFLQETSKGEMKLNEKGCVSEIDL